VNEKKREAKKRREECKEGKEEKAENVKRKRLKERHSLPHSLIKSFSYFLFLSLFRFTRTGELL